LDCTDKNRAAALTLGEVSIVNESDRTASNEPGRRERELQQKNDFHSVLLAMAGHDLRQPLQTIMSSYDWLARRLTSSSEQEYLLRGRSAISSLTSQLDLLIEALRLHEHLANIEAVPVALAPMFAQLCRDNDEMAKRKGLTLRTQPTSAAVMSDTVLLEGILRNLIRNALKYTGAGGRVLVGCRRRGTHLKIEVHDTGVGIPPDKLSKIFEAFQRLDSAGGDGLGLGLFVVRRAADLLGHGIEVRSTIGRGSCFSILTKTAGETYERELTTAFANEAQCRDKDTVPTELFYLPRFVSSPHVF
jgi:two-component system phosphate regulon sensor histidine kinase PhoR